MRAVLMAAVLLMGCGGNPRTNFTGEWVGQVTTTLTVDGQSGESQGGVTWDFGISDVGVDRIEWLTTACDFQAKVTSDTSLVLDAVNCRTETTDAGCSFQLSIDNGSGTRAGTSLTVTWGGGLTGQCSGNPSNGTYTSRFEGSRN